MYDTYVHKMARKGRRRYIGRPKKNRSRPFVNLALVDGFQGKTGQPESLSSPCKEETKKRKQSSQVAEVSDKDNTWIHPGASSTPKTKTTGTQTRFFVSNASLLGCDDKTEEEENQYNSEEPKKKRQKKGIQFRSYTTSSLNRALICIAKKGWSYRAASQRFKVPYQTLYKRMQRHKFSLGDLPKGPLPQVPSKVEEEIVTYLVTSARIGFAKTRSEVCILVKDILDDLNLETTFKENLPSLTWVHRFTRRHPILRMKSQEHHSKGRSEVTVEALKSWFSNIERRLRQAGLSQLLLDPERCFNMDESSFAFNYSVSKVLGVKNETTQRQVQGGEKDNITVAICHNANGDLLPPFIVHSGKMVRVLPEHKDLKVWRSASSSGWMTSVGMLEFCKKFAEHLVQKGVLCENSDKKKVLLYLDGQASHFSYSVLKFCKSVGIELVRLYPNSTHVIQPADCSLMKSAKAFWEGLLISSRNGTSEVDFTLKRNFPLAAARIAEHLESRREMLQKSFQKTGLYPFNSSAPNYELLLSVQRKKINAALNLQYDEEYWQEEVGDTLVFLDETSGEFVFKRNEHAENDMVLDIALEGPAVSENESEESEENGLFLDETTGLFLPKPQYSVDYVNLNEHVDELIRKEYRSEVLKESNGASALANKAAELLREKLKQNETKKVSGRRPRKQFNYHATSDENIQSQDSALVEDDWVCDICRYFYSEEVKKSKKTPASAWVSCDTCDLKYHIKCVSKAHAKSTKLVWHSKHFEDFDFKCQKCCTKICCSQS